MNQSIVIVGNGIAAINAIKAIREEDQETKIRLYGKEEFHPYNRIKLSKELLGNLAEDNVLLQNQEWYQENNVDLQLNTEVIYSTGIEANLNLVEGTDIKRNKGIIVDQKMETNIPDIYAAGDVIEFNNLIYGLWNLAINQGKVVGYNIIGEEKYYEQIIPLVTLRAFNLNLFSMGLVEADKATDFIVEQNEAERTYSKIFIKDNLIIGAIVIGDIRKSPVLKKAIEQEIDISTIDYKNVSIDQFLEIIRNK
jgi:nitrite reductase (NADH) large subunit